MKKLKVMLVMGGFCLVLPAWGLGLAESYTMALQHDPKLKVASLNLEATRYELDKAKSGYLPKVQLSLNRGRGSTESETANLATNGNRTYSTKNYGLTLKQPLINFGLSPQKNLAVENIAISELQLQAEAQNLFSRMSEKYFKVLYAADVLRANQNKLNSLEHQRIQADKRFRSGVAVKNDISDLDAELALSKAQILEAELQLTVSKKEFAVLVGSAPENLLGLDYQKLKDANLNERTLDDWLAIAQQKNPDLLQAAKQVNVSSFEHEKDKAMHYPTLDFLLSRTRTESDSNITIGSRYDTLSGILQLNVPIYSGGFVTASASQSAILVEAAKQYQDVKYTEILEKITTEYSSLHDAKHLMDAYDNAIRHYEVSLAGANKAYLVGTRTLSEVLKIRDRIIDTQLSLSKTCYSYLLSYIHLRALTGEIAQEDLILFNEFLKEEYFAFSGQSLAEFMVLEE